MIATTMVAITITIETPAAPLSSSSFPSSGVSSIGSMVLSWKSGIKGVSMRSELLKCLVGM